MAQADRLRHRDLREAYRLIGECRELGADPDAWRIHLLGGLRRLTGARLALYLEIRGLGTDAEAIAEPLDEGFLEAPHRALWLHYQRTRAHLNDPFHLRYYRAFNGTLRTRSLGSVVEMPAWRRSFHYNEYIRACGLDDRITSSAGLGEKWPSSTQVLVLHRSAHDGRFPPRAVRLVHLLHEELAPLTGRQLRSRSRSASSDLPFRLQQVLACLLRGEGEKQTAHLLGISRHTVNRHVQRLYRHFGVHSRGELMFRCRHVLPLMLAEHASASIGSALPGAKEHHGTGTG